MPFDIIGNNKHSNNLKKTTKNLPLQIQINEKNTERLPVSFMATEFKCNFLVQRLP